MRWCYVTPRILFFREFLSRCLGRPSSRGSLAAPVVPAVRAEVRPGRAVRGGGASRDDPTDVDSVVSVDPADELRDDVRDGGTRFR